jgi:hypothetical protein
MAKVDIGQKIVIRLPQELITDCHLSVPGWDELKGKNGYCRDKERARLDPNAPTSVTGRDAQGSPLFEFRLPYRSYDEGVCLLPYEDHLQRLGLKPEDPWLVIGARNLGNNLRIVGWRRDKGLLELNGEDATRREYHCLCKRKAGSLSMERIKFSKEGKPLSELGEGDLIWAVSGQCLLWDGERASIEQIIPYTYDLRHVWEIPDGDPLEAMTDEFMAAADSLPQEAASKLMNFATSKNYRRECNYLHSAVGISQDGATIVIVQQHGKFEDIAETLKCAEAYRAIELDQGGSCSVMIGGTRSFSPGRTIFASHHFRPRALSLIVFGLGQLDEETFNEASNLLCTKAMQGMASTAPKLTSRRNL